MLRKKRLPEMFRFKKRLCSVLMAFSLVGFPYPSAGAPPNQKPNVDAGTNQTVTFPGPANLDGTVTDDGKPNPPGVVTTLWTKKNGPGTVTFGDDTAVDTTATFSAAGSYQLTLTADDSEKTASDTVTITVVTNQAPAVDAGANQSVSFPGPANLDGTVTDDGLPNPPGAVTTLWTKKNGPGTVTFGDDTAVDTAATFSLPGNYQLTLTADDSALSSNDTIKITVNPSGSVNQAPVVDAGPSQIITLPEPALLSGTVTDDGLPNPPGSVTIFWSAVSGPASVLFNDPSATATTAEFTQAGTYVLRLTAYDGALTGEDDTTVSVQEPPPIAPGFDDRNIFDPAAGQTVDVTYATNTPGHIEITIFTILGEKVKVIESSFQSTGVHQANWDGLNNIGSIVASGVYLVNIKVDGVLKDTRKVVVIK